MYHHEDFQLHTLKIISLIFIWNKIYLISQSLVLRGNKKNENLFRI